MFRDTAAGDYSLQPCSPAIDAGDTTAISQWLAQHDFLGNPRLVNGKIDIGPIESPLPSLNLDSARVEGSCPGGLAGSVQFVPLNACPPFSVAWQKGIESGQNLTGLAPGNYTFSITDSRNRTATDTLTIPEIAPPDVLTTTESIICGDTIGGKAIATMPGGLSPLQFKWSDGATDSTRTGLAAGSIAVTVTDARRCANSAAVGIEKSGGLQIGIEVEPIRCFGEAKGSLQIVPLDGKLPYQFQWSNGATTDSIGSLAPGSFEGTLTDAYGCQISWLLPMTQPDELAAIATVTGATGATKADGKISIDSIFGGSQPYQIKWENGSNSLEISGLLPGIYTATITDVRDCEEIVQFTVSFVDAVGEADDAAAVRVFPNPFSDFLTVENLRSGSQNQPFQLFDAAGKRLIFTELPPVSRLKIDTQYLPSGNYFWKIGESRSGQLVK